MGEGGTVEVRSLALVLWWVGGALGGHLCLSSSFPVLLLPTHYQDLPEPGPARSLLFFLLCQIYLTVNKGLCLLFETRV